ncbi:hypothetical protein BAG01nite_23450 [Brevibacillus agri]|uniref:YviE n=1 Tax=Brevibacillus agri TaxID=51101 RepID=A0A3M8B7D1_9BACL|nr:MULTISPECIES: DUF6470 family protein [Brevibacillus]ELK42374.1 hypothetical protein D478_08778 [Brevibacillus agri BAB-2500]MDT7985593.1 DUF6470 family protein [Clostridium perfringens]MBY0050783.1 hypothetical protein [Brevibacillus agri]MCG5250142.1 DUF6470 family protein [Brevibacillus agri]MED3500770.1 DUF6470 family protein [Brevibacillus agri]
MRLPQIQIRQTYAQLGLKITKPVQEIRQPQAELNLRQEPAILDIKQAKGQLSIDTSEARENLDLRSSAQRTRNNADYGRQKVLEAIAQISMEGDRLAAIENKGANPIVDISFEESIIYQSREIIAEGSIIGDGIEIRYDLQPAQINVQVRGKKMDPVIHRPVHNYTPGKVEGYMRQWNRVEFDVVGLYVDQKM